MTATALESSGATTGYEAKLWEMADALRGSMDAALYKHVVLGLIFLKYVSDAFEETRVGLEAEVDDGADPEDPDEYRALNIFWVPKEARWSHLQAQARQPTIGQTVDKAMAAIERDNLALKGVLPQEYARPALDKRRLGDLIDLVGNIKVGDVESRSKDVLGRVYEYFLSRFADAEGKRGGEFYTPRSVVRLLAPWLVTDNTSHRTKGPPVRPLAALALCVAVACGTASQTQDTTTPTVTTVTDWIVNLDCDNSFNAETFPEFCGTSTTTTTTTAYVPRVASPFTAKELAFLNALAVVDSRNVRYTADGVDANGNGRIDHGWHELDWLEPNVDKVRSGHAVCDHGIAEAALARTPSYQREEVEQFILVARGWLC